jgi:hypothetical protein
VTEPSETPARPERPDKTTDWLRLYVYLRDNPKWLDLPSDGHRVAYVYALIGAFLERVRGVWLGREYLERALREYAAYLDDLIDADLIRERRDGTLAIPQWRTWQPITKAEAAKQDALLVELIEDRRRAKDRIRKRTEKPGTASEFTHGQDHIESERAREQESERAKETFASRSSDSSDAVSGAYAAMAAPVPDASWGCEICFEAMVASDKSVPLASGGIAHRRCAPPPDEEPADIDYDFEYPS